RLDIIDILQEKYDTQLENFFLKLKKQKSNSQLEQISGYGVVQSLKAKYKQ
ncbi:14024_t:CDS:1, partial [Gigaspora margarita]